MSLINDLITVRDYIRYATSRFETEHLVYGHGTESAAEDAVFLIMEALHLPLGDMAPWWDARLTQDERERVLHLINTRIETRKPSAYLVKKAYLQDMPFYVDERVIVPRSYLGEIITNDISDDAVFPMLKNPDSIHSVLELCAGSGCLSILAAQLFPNAQIDAVEICPGAIDVARRNVDDYGLGDQITLHEGDLFAPVSGKTYDLIFSNPPYVAPDSMDALPPEYRHEPVMALEGGGDDGMDLVQRILDAAPAHLRPDGGLLIEIGTGKDALITRAPNLPYLWLDTQNSSGEVFWLAREDMNPH